MRAALIAGALYFAGAFALGFGLGTVRVLLLQPRLGSLLAVLTELPVMLLATWWLCARLIRAWQVEASIAARVAMGSTGLILLLSAETSLFSLLNGQPVRAFLATLVEPAGMAGLVGQGIYALFPLMQGMRGADR